MFVLLPHLVWKSLMNFTTAVFWAVEPWPDSVPLAQLMSPPPPVDEPEAEDEVLPPAAEVVDEEPPELDEEEELLSEPQAVRPAMARARTPAPTAALRPLKPAWIFTGEVPSNHRKSLHALSSSKLGRPGESMDG
jgi:hypothetical protein